MPGCSPSSPPSSAGIAGKRHCEENEAQTEEVGIAGLRDGELAEAEAKDDIHQEQAQQRKAADAQAHDGAAAEGDLNRLADVPSLAGLVGHADVGIGGDLHADKAGTAGHDRTDQQGDCRVPGGDDCQQHRDDGDDSVEHPVLIVDERIGADADGRGKLAHLLRALGHLSDTQEVEGRKGQRQPGGKDDQNQ